MGPPDEFGQIGWPGPGWERLPDVPGAGRHYASSAGAPYDAPETISVSRVSPDSTWPAAATAILTAPVEQAANGELSWQRLRWEGLSDTIVVLNWRLSEDPIWHPPPPLVALHPVDSEGFDALVASLAPVVEPDIELLKPVLEAWRPGTTIQEVLVSKDAPLDPEGCMPDNPVTSQSSLADHAQLVARVSHLVDRCDDIERFAMTYFLLGSRLAAGQLDSDTAQQAVWALRRALRYITEPWRSYGLATLGHVFVVLADHRHGAAERMARRAFQLAATAYAERGEIDGLGMCLTSAAELDLAVAGDDPLALRKARQLLDGALQICTPETSPLIWARASLALVRTLTSGGRLHTPEAYEKARSVALEVQRVTITHPRLKTVPGILALSFHASSIAAALHPTDDSLWQTTPFNVSEALGQVLYLRPWSSVDAVRVPERCADPSVFVLRRSDIGDQIDLEVALNRALLPHFLLLAVGGSTLPGGGARTSLLGAGDEWQDIVKDLLPRMAIVVLLAADTAAVRWEVQAIIDSDVLGRVLVVMLPVTAIGVDAASLWEAGKAIFAGGGIDLPAYDPAGAFVVLKEDGSVHSTRPFDGLYSTALRRWLGDWVETRMTRDLG